MKSYRAYMTLPRIGEFGPTLLSAPDSREALRMVIDYAERNNYEVEAVRVEIA